MGWKLAFLASLNPRDPVEKPERRELVRLGRARAFVLLRRRRRADVSRRRKGQAHQHGARRGASGHRRGNSRRGLPVLSIDVPRRIARGVGEAAEVDGYRADRGSGDPGIRVLGKDFGYIVDYKDLFKKVENAIAVYTSELDRSSGGDPEVRGRQRWTYKEILLLISG